MAEVPHCPECHRADRVKTQGTGYQYYCDYPSCCALFEPDDVTDGPWVDMVKDSMFNDPVDTTLQAAKIIFADDCSCDYCSRIEEGKISVEEMAELTEENMLEKF